MNTKKPVSSVIPPPPESVVTKTSSPDSAQGKPNDMSRFPRSKRRSSAISPRPRVQVVWNSTVATPAELSSWMATWVSDVAVDCTMTSTPGMGSGSRQGLHVPQGICGTIAQQFSNFVFSSALNPLLFVLSHMLRLTGHASSARGSAQTSDTGSLQGKVPRARNVESSSQELSRIHGNGVSE